MDAALSVTDDDSPARVAIVVGEPGLGKTTLLDATVDRIASDGTHLTLRANCDAAEAGLDFAVVDQLVRAWRGPSGTPLSAITAAAGPFEVGARLVQLSDALSDSQRLLIVVDDAQDADEVSLQALAFAARRLRADRVALLVASRPEGLRRLPEGLVRLAGAAGVVTVNNLTCDEVHRLATALRGSPVTESSARRLHRHTGGHPLHVRVLLDAHRDTGEAIESPLAPTLTRLLTDRLMRCSPEATRLLHALTVLASPSALHLAASVAQIDDPLAVAAELADAGLIDVTNAAGGSMRPDAGAALLAPRHQLISEVAYADIDAASRVEMHRRAATLVSGSAALRHRVTSSRAPDTALATALIAQAEADHSRGAAQAAAEHLYTAASFAEQPDRSRLILRGADLLVALGRLSATRVDEVERLPDSARRSLVLARAAMAVGRFGEAKRMLNDAWSRIGSDEDADDTVAATIAECLAIIALSDLDPDDVVRWGERIATTGAAALSTTMIVHGMAMRGEFDEARRRAEEDLALATPVSHRAIDARLARGVVGAWSNRLEDARRDFSAVLSGAQDRSLLQTLSARAHLADVHLRSGNLVEAADMAAEGVQLLNDAQADWLAPLPYSVSAYVHTVLGDFEQATMHAAAAAAYARATGDAPAMIWSEAAWLRLADARGEAHEVVEVGDRMLTMGLDAVAEGINRWRAAYIESLATVGRMDDAAAVLRVLQHQLADSDDTSLAAEVARARAALAGHAGDSKAALAALEEGLALDAVLSRPLPRALLELTAGSFLRRIGQRNQASEHLQNASRRLARMGARPWQERCARELAACGVRPARRSRVEAHVELTPQERMVARLVAEGHSNREVAGELYVSVKTVEHHLSRVYAKLGVRNRVQMSAALPDALA